MINGAANTVFIALLRGINVGGHKIIPMAKLKAIFESGGLAEVRTYIQSGNVVFTSPDKKSDIVRAKVERTISRALGYDVPTIVRSSAEMKKVVAGNMYADEHAKGKTKLYVLFLEKKPSVKERDEILALQVKGMSLHFGTRELYCLLDARFSGNNSPFSAAAVEKILRQKATARNWATTTTLLEMALQ